MRGNGNGNGTRPRQEIQAEIDRTRQEMDGTLSAIEHRLSPGQLIDQGMSYLRQNGAQEFVANLGQQAKTNPMPVALVGIGLAWLMATGKGPDLSRGGSTLGEKTGAMRDKAGEMRERASQLTSSTRDQLSRARDGIDTMMREQPLGIGALGLALGALAAVLAPRTQAEERYVAPARDRMVEKAAEAVKGEKPDDQRTTGTGLPSEGPLSSTTLPSGSVR